MPNENHLHNIKYLKIWKARSHDMIPSHYDRVWYDDTVRNTQKKNLKKKVSYKTREKWGSRSHPPPEKNIRNKKFKKKRKKNLD